MGAEVFFTTDRLSVRAMQPADVEAFVAYRSDPEVARYQSWSDYTREQGRALVADMQSRQPGTPGEWVQLALDDGTALVGDLAVCVDADEHRQLEVGFTLAPGQQRKGYATEALCGLVGHAFGAWGMHRVVAITDTRNDAAAALLRRVGFRQEGHFVDNVFFKGAWGSELLFAVLESEWAVR
jgi:RimJ/RimL family protein N-acetyltransferase